MARKVFFSFHYDDIMNANIVRNSGEFKPTAETGFYDASLWEDAMTKGDAAVKELIDEGLNNTGVTVFLIGMKTYSRPYCQYELKESVKHNKGLLGIQLPNEKDTGPNTWLKDLGVPVYNWNHERFAGWVEEAAKKAGR